MIFSLNNLLFFILFMSCFYYTLSDIWITELEIPDPDKKMLCEDWIKFYGFTHNADKNRDKAVSRNKSKDGEVFAWTASYAMHLTTFPHNLLGSYEFCDMHQISYVSYKYKPLNKFELSCSGWIDFHTYYKTTSEQIGVRLSLIENRNKNEDIYNSIWATSYFRFVDENKRYALMLPVQYCIAIGSIKSSPEWLEVDMPYMTINDTKMVCHKWVKLHGFTDNVHKNRKMVFNRERIYDDFINYWAFKYTQHIRTSRTTNTLQFELTGQYIMTPNEFCEKILNKTSEELPFDNIDNLINE